MSNVPKPSQIEAELHLGRQARRAGNEGKARVHARRAAGWAIGLDAHRRGTFPGTGNAYRLLEWLSRDPSVDEGLRSAARRLTVHIDPDHRLPHDQDPLEDADRIVRACLPELAAK